MDKKENVLISGGSGLVGLALTHLLIENGYEVCHISRSKSNNNKIKSYRWDIESNFLEEGAIENADVIIHLAGATVSKRWTPSYKKIIIDSRVDSGRLLVDKIRQVPNHVHTFISASGINIYPDDASDKSYQEDDVYGNKFLAEVCKKWENATSEIEDLSIRRVLIRIGVVLSDESGALPKMLTPIKFGFGSPLGDGRQWMSWIHIDDLCRMFLHAIRNKEIIGPYNAVSDSPARNYEFMKTLAKTLNKPFFLPNVPGFLLKLILGEMSTIVLNGVKVSNKKIRDVGFQFKMNHLDKALTDLLLK